MTDFINYLLNGLSLGCIYALIAVGYSMVYGIIKLINFAHGEIYMVGAFFGYFVLTFVFNGVPNGPELPLLAAVAAILASGAGAGGFAVIIERIVYRPLRNSGRIVALLAALGVSLFLQNAGQQTVGAKERTFPHTFTFQRFPRSEMKLEELKPDTQAAGDLAIVYQRKTDDGRLRTLVENVASRGDTIRPETVEKSKKIIADASAQQLPATLYSYPAITVTNSQILILTVLAIISAGLYFLVQHTRFGRAMRAVSHDFDAASLMGIDVNRVIAGTFFIGAFVAGVGGTLAGGMYYGQIGPLMGLMPGLKAFVAAVFGGIGSIPGALLGGLLLGTTEKLIEAYGSSLYSDAFTFSLLIFVLVVKPSGLLGKASGEKM